MRGVLLKLSRLIHPITLAVILIGVGGFLLGLIVAVERQDRAQEAAQAAAVRRIEQLDEALQKRETALTEARAALAAAQRSMPVAPAQSGEVTPNVKAHIATLEKTLAERTAELHDLQGELTKLSSQLAEAIQKRDELAGQLKQAGGEHDAQIKDLENAVAAARQQTAESERARAALEARVDTLRQQSAEGETARAAQEKTIADLRHQLEETEAARTALESKVAQLRQQIEAAGERDGATSTPPEAPPQTAVAPADRPAPPPAAAEPAKPEEPVKPAKSPAPAGKGPVAQGIAAYQAGDYRRAYELWLPEALKGSHRAQFFVGALYFEGRGVPADRVTSYMWLRAATKKDDPGAIKLLDRVREGMTGEELAEAEKRIASGETIPAQ